MPTVQCVVVADSIEASGHGGGLDHPNGCLRFPSRRVRTSIRVRNQGADMLHVRATCTRTLWTACTAAGLLALSVLSASAGNVRPFEGNDTGGIIAWSPEAYRYRHAIAGDHCAQYTKVHRITSAVRRYGEYIGFECYWPRGTGGGVILRRMY